jgi:hypothetical protein
MYPFLHNLLSDKKGGEIFSCFGLWHFIYIALAAMTLALLFLSLKNKDKGAKNRVMLTLINISFGLYILDFFLMPFAYNEIDIEKLPFHICTAMCVMCFLSNHIDGLKPLRVHFALLGFISNLVYLIYPAGVMWHATHPLSYRVVQTLIFHGIMSVYGLLTLIYDGKELSFKTCYRDLAIIFGMTVWALIGNLLYNGEAGEYSHFFNWFFVIRDPFYMLPANIAPFIMPFVNIGLFFGVEMLVYLIIKKSKRENE